MENWLKFKNILIARVIDINCPNKPELIDHQMRKCLSIDHYSSLKDNLIISVPQTALKTVGFHQRTILSVKVTQRLQIGLKETPWVQTCIQRDNHTKYLFLEYEEKSHIFYRVFHANLYLFDKTIIITQCYMDKYKLREFILANESYINLYLFRVFLSTMCSCKI